MSVAVPHVLRARRGHELVRGHRDRRRELRQARGGDVAVAVRAVAAAAAAALAAVERRELREDAVARRRVGVGALALPHLVVGGGELLDSGAA